jgi:hypothetical protein
LPFIKNPLLLLLPLLLCCAWAEPLRADAASGDGTCTVAPASLISGVPQSLVLTYTDSSDNFQFAGGLITFYFPPEFTAPNRDNFYISPIQSGYLYPTAFDAYNFLGATVTVKVANVAAGTPLQFYYGYNSTGFMVVTPSASSGIIVSSDPDDTNILNLAPLAAQPVLALSSPTVTSTSTITPTYTGTPTQTADASPTITVTATPPPPGSTATVTPSITQTPSRTFTMTSTISLTRTGTLTCTGTRTGTGTRTSTVSPSVSQTPTGVRADSTPTDTPSVSPTVTATPTGFAPLGGEISVDPSTLVKQTLQSMTIEWVNPLASIPASGGLLVLDFPACFTPPSKANFSIASNQAQYLLSTASQPYTFTTNAGGTQVSIKLASVPAGTPVDFQFGGGAAGFVVNTLDDSAQLAAAGFLDGPNTNPLWAVPLSYQPVIQLIDPTPVLTATLTPTPSITPTFSISPTWSVSPTITVTYTTTPLGKVIPNTAYAYPNPFDLRFFEKVTLRFPPDHGVVVDIFKVSGEPVTQLRGAAIDEAVGWAIWDGRDQYGRQVAGGVYFYRIRGSARKMMGKFTVLH